LYKLCELNPNYIALAIEAAKAKAQGVPDVIITNTTNKHFEKLTGDGGTTN